MIDPTAVTDYNRTVPQLEEYLSFCICVAGNNAKSTAKGLQAFLEYAHQLTPAIGDWQPFDSMQRFKDADEMRWKLKEFGIGKHENKSKGLYNICNIDLDLKRVSRETLITYPAIGMKTATYFILHSRPDIEMACFDRHMCRWFGIDIPKSVKEYLAQEKEYIKKAKDMGLTCAQLDLKVWNEAQND